MLRPTHCSPKNTALNFCAKKHTCVFAAAHLVLFFAYVIPWLLRFINFLTRRAFFIYIHRSLQQAMLRVRVKCFALVLFLSTILRGKKMAVSTLRKTSLVVRLT